MQVFSVLLLESRHELVPIGRKHRDWFNVGASDRVALYFCFGVNFCIFPGFYYLREFAFVSEAFGGVDAGSFLRVRQ